MSATLTLKRKAAPPEKVQPAPKASPKPRSFPGSPAAPIDAALFWLIWSPGAFRPSKRHSTLDIAMAEAQRLRSVYPNHEFFIFEARRIDPPDGAA